MISIDKLFISKDLKNIHVNISSNNNSSKFTKVFIWNSETFRDYSKAIDVSELLSKSSNKEEFLISAETLGVQLINGLYFIEFRNDAKNQTLGVVANLFAYRECLLNKVISIEISGCGHVKSECENCTQNICLLNTLIDNLGTAILQGFVEEAAKIVKDIEGMCDVCHTCPDYNNTKSFHGEGLGYQIINNEILSQGKEKEPECNPALPAGTNEFIPTYIKHIPSIDPSVQNVCTEYIPECYEEIAYFYLPGGVNDFNNYNKLYKEPNLDSIYQPINNKVTYFQVSNNPLKSGADITEDIISLYPDSGSGIEIKYYCCACPN